MQAARQGAGNTMAGLTPGREITMLVGADTDSERAVRWLILLMVLTRDPLAIALTAAAAATGGR